MVIAVVVVLVIGIAAKGIIGIRRIENANLTGQAVTAFMPAYQPSATPQYAVYAEPAIVAQPAIPAYPHYAPRVAPATVAPAPTNMYWPMPLPSYTAPYISPWAAIYAALMGAPTNDRRSYTPTIADCDANGNGRCFPEDSCDDSDDDRCRDSVSALPGIMRRVVGMFVATAHAQNAQVCTISVSVDRRCKGVPFDKGACAAEAGCIGNSNPGDRENPKRFTCRAAPTCTSVPVQAPLAINLTNEGMKVSCSLFNPDSRDVSIDVKATVSGGRGSYSGRVGNSLFTMTQASSVGLFIGVGNVPVSDGLVSVPVSASVTDSSVPIRGSATRTVTMRGYDDQNLSFAVCRRHVCAYRQDIGGRYLSQTPTDKEIEGVRAQCEEQGWCVFKQEDPVAHSSCHPAS